MTNSMTDNKGWILMKVYLSIFVVDLYEDAYYTEITNPKSEI
jgi:superoxide dismutase